MKYDGEWNILPFIYLFLRKNYDIGELNLKTFYNLIKKKMISCTHIKKWLEWAKHCDASPNSIKSVVLIYVVEFCLALQTIFEHA